MVRSAGVFSLKRKEGTGLIAAGTEDELINSFVHPKMEHGQVFSLMVVCTVKLNIHSSTHDVLSYIALSSYLVSSPARRTL